MRSWRREVVVAEMSLNPLPSLMQEDLNTILNESQKKYSEIRESVTRIINATSRHNKATKTASLKNHDFALPFLLCCKTKNPRLINPALAYLQRLVAHVRLQEELVPPIVAELSNLALANQSYQVKIMQCFLALYTGYSGATGTLLTKTFFTTCLAVLGNTQSQVKEIVFATTRQLAIYLFDRAADLTVDGQSGDPSNMSAANDAVAVFKDVCTLLNGSEPAFLDLTDISSIYGIALLESILSETVKYFKEHESIFPTIKYTLCPFIIRSLSEAEETFSLYYRITRLVYVIINSYRSGLVIETEILLSTLRIVAISPKTPIPNRIVVIETISSLISNPDILEFICKNCVNNENVSDICAAVIPNPNELLLSSITAPEGVNRLNRLLSTEDLPYKLEEAFSQAARSKYIDAVEKLGALDVTEINAIPQACDYVHTLILSLSKLFDPRGSCHDVDTCPSFNSESLSKLLDKLEDFFVNVFKLPLPHSSLLSLLDDLYSLSILIWERPPGALQDQCLKLFQSAYKDNFLKAHNAGIHPENLLASAGTLAKTPPLEDNDSSSSHKKDQDEVVAPSQATEVRVFIISKMSDFILAFKSAISDSQWEHILTFLEFITNLLNINIIQPKDAHLDNLVECTSGISQRYQKCVSRGEAQDTPVNLDNGIGGAIDPAILKHFGCLLSRIISGGDYKAVIRIVKAASETSKKIIRLSALQDPPEANLSSKRIHIMCVFYIKFIWKLTLLNLEKIAKDEDTDLYFDISLVFGHYSNNLEPQNLFDIALRAHISITNSFISYTGRSENTRLYLKVLSSAKLTCFHNVFSYVEFTGTRDWDEILHYPTRSSPDTHEVFRHVWMLRVLCIFLRHPKLLKFLAKELYKIMEDCASVYMPTLCTVRYGPYIKDDIDQMLFTTKNYYKLSRLIYNFIKDSLSSEYLPDHLNIMERARCIILGISLESSDIVNVVNFMRLMYVLLRSLFEVYAQKSEHELSINISGIQIRDIKKVNPGIMLFNDINSPRKNNALRKVVIAATDKHILNNLLCNCVYSILKYTLHSLPEIRLLAFNSLFNLMDKYFLYISDTNLKLKIADILLSMTGYHIGLPSSSGVDLSFGCRCTYKSEPLTEVAKIGDPANFDNIGTIISRTSSIICQMLDTLSEPHAQMSELCNKIVDIAEECFYNYTKDVSVTSLHALETILELESLRNTVFAHCASKIRMKIFETCKNISQSIDTSGERIFLAPDNDRMVLTKVVCTPYQILVLMGVFVIAYSALPENQFLENFGTATDIITTFLKCPIIMAVTGHPQSFYDSTKLKNNYVCMPSNLHKKAEDLLSRLSVDRNKNKLVPGFASKVLSSIHSEIMLTTNNPSAGPTNVFSREYMQINCVSAAKQFMRSLQKSVVHIARYSGPSMAVPISSTIDNLVDFISFEGNEAVANGELDLIDLAEDSLYTMCNIIESVIVNIRGDDISSIITSDDIKYIHSKITAPHSPLFQSIRRSLRNKKNVNLTDDVVELFLNATRDIISYFCQTSNVSEDLSELGSLVKTLVDGTTVYYTHSSIYGELSPESIDFFNTSAPYCVVLPQKNLIIGCYSVVEELCSRYKKFNDRNVRIASELAARALYKKSRATLLDLVNNISIHDGIPLSDIQYTELLLILESLLRIRVIPGALRDYFSNNKDAPFYQFLRNSECSHLFLLAPYFYDLCEVILNGGHHFEGEGASIPSDHGVNTQCAAAYATSKKCLQVIWNELGVARWPAR